MNLSTLEDLAARARRLAVRPPAAHGDWYRVTAAAGDRAEVFIYGVIGSDWDDGDVTAAGFVRELRAIKAPRIDLHLNSPGGSVFDGIAIHAALRNHPATVTSYVDGVAASAASFVAMAGDEVVIEKPAKMMIHDASGLVIGDAADMREMADLLDELSDTIAGIYTDRAGRTVAHWRSAMRAETWYGAAEAVAAGLADRVAGNGDPPAGNSLRSQLVRARARVTLKG